MAKQQKTSRGKSEKLTVPDQPRDSGGARSAGALLCLLLALCAVMSYFHVDALFLNFFAKTLQGLFGWGYYAAAIMLAVCGVLLLRRDRPVARRVLCALAVLPLVGALVHLFLGGQAYGDPAAMIQELWDEGQTQAAGGVLSGGIALGLRTVFGKAIAVILLAALLAAAVMAVFHVSAADILRTVRRQGQKRKASADDVPWDEPVRSQRQVAIETAPRRRTRRPIDIPLDGETPDAGTSRRSPEQLPPKQEGRRGLFAPKPEEVVTPAEVLTTEQSPADKGAEDASGTDKPPEARKRRRKEREASREEVAAAAQEVTQEIAESQGEAEEAYRYPPIHLLEENRTENYTEVGAELRTNSRRLAETLRSFGVDAAAGEVVHGPSVTRYEFTLDQGVKLSKITNLSDDIALALGTSGVRIAPIPNKSSVVGMEVPNRVVTPVRIRDVVESKAFTHHKSPVAFAVGKDIGGSQIVGDIARLPHVLIAGTTGSGKSVCTNSLIVSLLYRSTPEEVRFIMVDPKMVELAPYNGIPHLLIPVVTDPKKAAGALQWAVFEMMKRYKLFSEHGVKDLAGFNALAQRQVELEKLPTVVVVIDELADLMLVAAKEVEESICRVAQMGRAAGMHLVIATQSPRADVITGLMKANIPSRIAFAVASSLESRIILDTTGAEKLVGKGDMLYFPLGMQKPLRVQGCFITPEEIERVVAFVKDNGETDYDQGVMDQIEAVLKKEEKGKSAAGEDEGAVEDGDELLPAAIDVVMEVGSASVSMLQRRLKLGYSRAARLVDQMEERGIVGAFEGSKPRQLLITKEQWQEMKMKHSGEEMAPQPEFDRFGTISDMFKSHDALE